MRFPLALAILAIALPAYAMEHGTNGSPAAGGNSGSHWSISSDAGKHGWQRHHKGTATADCDPVTPPPPVKIVVGSTPVSVHAGPPMTQGGDTACGWPFTIFCHKR